MWKRRTEPRRHKNEQGEPVLDHVQDDYIFCTPSVVKITPEEFFNLEVRMASQEKYENGKLRFLPHDNPKWLACEIVEVDPEEDTGSCYGVCATPYFDYLKQLKIEK